MDCLRVRSQSVVAIDCLRVRSWSVVAMDCLRTRSWSVVAMDCLRSRSSSSFSSRETRSEASGWVLQQSVSAQCTARSELRISFELSALFYLSRLVLDSPSIFLSALGLDFFIDFFDESTSFYMGYSENLGEATKKVLRL